MIRYPRVESAITTSAGDIDKTPPGPPRVRHRRLPAFPCSREASGPRPGADRSQISAPHRELLDQVLDKWSLQVLDSLCEQPSRSTSCAGRSPS
ncbi:hypothetical protein [Streptomonospora arabica]|uniref:HTH hxlR-type domain-containing protein n=1 Tax=Streptomonospora arabica TaxID=412417 RepID=A0ABV9SR18_9ACTN